MSVSVNKSSGNPKGGRTQGLGARHELIAEGSGAAVQDTALEATQGQFDGFFCPLPYKCYQNRVAYVGD